MPKRFWCGGGPDTRGYTPSWQSSCYRPRRTVEPALRHPPYEKTPNLLNRLCNGTVEVDSYLVNQQSTSPARFLYVSGRYAAPPTSEALSGSPATAGGRVLLLTSTRLATWVGYLVKLYGARRASERAVLKAEYEAGASIRTIASRPRRAHSNTNTAAQPRRAQ